VFTAHGFQNDRLQRQSAQFIVIVNDVNLRVHPDEVVIPVGLEFGGNFGALFRDEVDEYLLLWGPAILPVGTIPGKREYSPWEPPKALLGATWPSTGGRSRAVSRPGRRRTDCRGQIDRHCKALDEQAGSILPPWSGHCRNPPAESACTCCLSTSHAAADGRRPARSALRRTGDSVPASTTTRSWTGHPQHPLDRC
jgi:hypothetical protein